MTNELFYSIKVEEDLDHLENIEEVSSLVNDIRLQENLGKQKYCYVPYNVSEPVTKAIKNTFEKILVLRQSAIKSIEELNNSNVYGEVSKLMKENPLIDGYSIVFSAILVEPGSKIQFRLYDDPDFYWYDFILNSEKITKKGATLFFI